ncbi:MAG: alanine:cation symporter family protein [Gammaproteobacteria bacterium]|nr:alanine:cation symporter family protein [Gammaproteobacteria bacterium]
MSVTEWFEAVMRPLADVIGSIVFFSISIFGSDVPLIVIWLIAGGVFFTGYLKFINVRGFAEAIRVVRGRYADPNDPGEISQFQALTTAVSGTVGISNIAGVAIAISIGGPGATFWLIVAGLLGMSTKFAECTLGVRYREVHADGSVSGGPMYYLSHGLSDRGWPRLGKALAIFYAISLVLGGLGGNLLQSNQSTAILLDVFGDGRDGGATWWVGIALAITVGLVIIGGIKSIARVTARVVPTMALLYIGTAILVLIINAERIPGALAAIWNGAFSAPGITGGAVGALIMGFRRAVFSNEAGLGTAAIAHSAARTPYPASEGYVALLEPFLDTVVICTMTALVIVTTVYEPGSSVVDGIELTSRAFATAAWWAPIPLSIAAFLFAYTTVVAWAYYGLKAFTFVVGESRLADMTFKLAVVTSVIIGSSIELRAIVDLADALVLLIAVPNLAGLYLLAPVVRIELNRFQRHVLRADRTHFDGPTIGDSNIHGR